MTSSPVIGAFAIASIALLATHCAEAAVLDVGQSARVEFTSTTGTPPFDFVTLSLDFSSSNPFGPNESLMISTFDASDAPLVSMTVNSGAGVYTSGPFGALTENAIAVFNPATALQSDTFYATVTDLSGSFDLIGAQANFEHVLTQGTNELGVVGIFAASAPEPSTWALLLLGFAGLAYIGYRNPNHRRVPA